MTHHPLASHFFVLLQFSSIGVGFYPFADTQNPIAWLAITGLGVLVGIYTLMHNKLGNFAIYPEILDNANFIVTGPYQWVRHPMYLSVMLFMLGMVIYNNHWINTLSLITLSLAILGKMHKEELYLQTHFSNYADYMRSHKRLIPLIY